MDTWNQKPRWKRLKLWIQQMDLHSGQVLWWLASHLSKQFLWKKCLQVNTLTSCSSPNLDKQTQHFTLLPSPRASLAYSSSFLHNFWNWAFVIPLLLEGLFGGQNSTDDGFSPKLEEIQAVAPINWSTDLSKFFSIATDITVFITNTGSTPSAALGKFDNPISSFLSLTSPNTPLRLISPFGMDLERDRRLTFFWEGRKSMH